MLEQLLQLDDLTQTTADDPLWKHFPLRTRYDEVFQHTVQAQHAKNLKYNLDQTAQIEPLKEGRIQKRIRKIQSQKQLNDGWFGMKSQEQTQEAKNDYLMLKLKKYLDPKNPGKSQEFQKMPQFFQIGTVIDGGGFRE